MIREIYSNRVEAEWKNITPLAKGWRKIVLSAKRYRQIFTKEQRKKNRVKNIFIRVFESTMGSKSLHC